MTSVDANEEPEPEPDWWPSFCDDIHQLVAEGDFARARYWSEAAVAIDLDALGPRMLLAHVLYEEGRDPVAAERALRDVLLREPGYAWAWVWLALLLDRQGRGAEAEAACRAARDRCPDDVEVLGLHGMLLAGGGDADEAEACLLQALASRAEGLPPERERGRRCRLQDWLAWAYLRCRRYRLAEALWRGVVAEQPRWERAWHGLGLACLEQRAWAELARVCRRLRALPEGHLPERLLRAAACLYRDDLPAARRTLERLVQRCPHDPRPWAGLADVLDRAGDRRAALAALRRARALRADGHLDPRMRAALAADRDPEAKGLGGN
jgi:Tfp pilus assembly protein PilF